MRVRAVAASLLLLTACADEGAERGAPVEPPSALGGKADVSERVTLRGALDFGEAATGEMTEDLQFDAYTFAARAGAVVDLEITQRGTTRRIDTTLFVYGPGVGGSFGTTALAADDDSGWGPHARLRGLTLDAGGTYLEVVGTHDARGRGSYRLALDCPGGDCAPAPQPEPSACPELIAQRVEACVADQLSDTEAGWTAPDAFEACLDAEPFAVGYDAQCAAAPVPACDLPYEQAWSALVGPCRDALAPRFEAPGCVFGDTWQGLGRTPGVAVTAERRLRAPDDLDALTGRQIVAAMQAAGHTDVATVDAAFERADAGEINVVDLWDATNGRAFVGVEFGAGDTSVGAIFPADGADPVAVNGDGDLYQCAVTPGPAGRDCSADADCARGLTCAGRADGVGRCADTSRHPAEGTECSADTACAAGLLCAGISRDPSWGLCLPAWMRQTFVSAGPATLDADAGELTLDIPARGLASVDMDVVFGAEVVTEGATHLTITLTNPSGNEVTVFDAPVAHDTHWIDVVPRGFSGDEDVNGTWTLRVVDGGRVGLTLERWHLTIGSRWD